MDRVYDLESHWHGCEVEDTRQKLDTSERRTCAVLGMSRSSLRYRVKPTNDDALRLTMIRLAKQYGRYGYRKVNGPEFIAGALQDWLKKVNIQPMQICPGSPWENGYNERFNGTLRREVLNAECFHSTRQAQVAINVWLRQYNRIRPHHALNMRPPVPETLLEKTKITGTEIGG